MIIPCRNEELTVAQVINDTREAIPGCQIWVYDNNSTDETAKNASEAGAFLKFESDIGKGNVIRRALAEIKAESYVIIDGDGTYDPSEAPILLKTLLEGNLDMVVGCRSGAINRSGHRFGNAVFNRLYRWLFGEDLWLVSLHLQKDLRLKQRSLCMPHNFAYQFLKLKSATEIGL